MNRDNQLNIRATANDLANLAIVGAHLQASGIPFVTRSDALRHALSYAATAVTILARPQAPAA